MLIETLNALAEAQFPAIPHELRPKALKDIRSKYPLTDSKAVSDQVINALFDMQVTEEHAKFMLAKMKFSLAWLPLLLVTVFLWVLGTSVGAYMLTGRWQPFRE